MEPLSVGDFETFFQEVHGYTPFHWQQDLLDAVAADHRWPEVIDLPTGAGKTACIDVALFALALDAVAVDPWCPRRIAMVVDRRVVVDQAARRAHVIARALRQAPNGSVTARLAERLAHLSAEKNPLRVAVLRGGIPREDGWARTPDQPLVVASTVDQLGSRLLFRGYGVSRSMAPVHAGLIGNDTLVLLDEVHLSRPFHQTLEAVATMRGESFLRNRLHVVALSATPGEPRTPPFRLSPADRRTDAPLHPRLSAKKPAQLRECEGRAQLVDIAVEEALDLVTRHQAVAVVVNRVHTAHQIARRLHERDAGDSPVDVVLLTGRMRPLERDEVVHKLEPRVGAIPGRRKLEASPVIVVATQCIEAGADFDFDALVTEHASLDALRQRFGRVDRLGEYDGRAEGVIVAVREPNDKGKLEVTKDDPIYGESLHVSWKALQELGGRKKDGKIVDFGVDALDEKLGRREDVPSLLAPKPRAPALFPAYLDLWIQTAPRPIVDPEVALFLHGPKTGPADIQIVWRVDLDDAYAWRADDADEPLALGRVEALPPCSLEAVSVPFGLARRWLVDDARDDEFMADVERSSIATGEAHARVTNDTPLAVVWRGEDSFVLYAKDIRKLGPGDTLVVPSLRGGLFRGSFDPMSTDPVRDLAERANLLGRGRPVLRLHARVLEAYGLTLADGDVSAPDVVEPWLRALVEGLGSARRIVVDEALTVLRGRRRVHYSGVIDEDETSEATTDEAISSFTGRVVKLFRHCRDVEGWVRRFAANLRLAKPLVEAIALAGWLHDVGKADPRFQRLLRDGGEISIWKDQQKDPVTWHLAKSGMGPHERRRMREAARKSGYPRGTRHEVLSLAMVDHDTAVRTEAEKRGVDDLDLVFHLVASHHGWCRPFAPAVEEPSPNLVVTLRHGDLDLEARAGHGLERLDSLIADRFFGLVAKYGWHQLAWLEAILRLADHRASEAEQEDTDGHT